MKPEDNEEQYETLDYGAPGESPTGTLNGDGSRLGIGGEGGHSGGGGGGRNPTGGPSTLPVIGGEYGILREDGAHREINPSGYGTGEYHASGAPGGDASGIGAEDD